jgi:hypothetical protein
MHRLAQIGRGDPEATRYGLDLADRIDDKS